MSNIIIFGLRGFQALFSIVVLGLAITLIKGQQWGGTPISMGFVAFVGGISLLGAIFGFASTFFDFLQNIISVGIDVFLVLLNIAGGALFAIKLKGANCQDTSDAYRVEKLKDLDLVNGGCQDTKKYGNVCANWQDGREKYLNSRCREATADSVFMFLTVIVLLVTATLLFLKVKRN